MRLAFVIALALLTSCGGGGPAGPTPLGHTLDEAYIARIPPDQRPAVGQTQQDYAMAKSEKLTASDAVDQATTDLKLAKGEVEAAVIEEKQAKVKVDAAKSSADQTRVNAAEHEARAALLGRRQADAKVSYAKAKLSYQKKWLRYTEYNVYAKEAKFEFEKAKIAKANNISPKGFAYAAFESQARNRAEAAQRAKVEADRAKQGMTDKEKAWKAAEKEWNEFRGIKTMPEAPPTTPDGALLPTGTPPPATPPQ